MLSNSKYSVSTTPSEKYEFMHSLKLPIHIYQMLLASKNIEIELPNSSTAEGYIYDHGNRIATVTSVGTIADSDSYILDNDMKSLIFHGKLDKKLHAVGDVDILASELRTKTKKKEQERSESKIKIINKPVDASVNDIDISLATEVKTKTKRKEQEGHENKPKNMNKSANSILSPDEVAATKRSKYDATNASSKPLHAATNQWLVMRKMPSNITLNQIKIFFSGLTVVNIYAFVPPSPTTTSDSIEKGNVDIYVEFESINGASLGYYRNNESITSSGTDAVPVTLEYVSNSEAFWAKGTCFNMSKISSLQAITASKMPACITQVCSLAPAVAIQKWLFLENEVLHPDSLVGFSSSNRAKNNLKLCKMEPYFYNSTVLIADHKHAVISPQLSHESEHVTAIDTIIQETMQVLHQVTLTHSSYLLDTFRESGGSAGTEAARVSSDEWMESLSRIKELYEILYILSVKQRDNLCILV